MVLNYILVGCPCIFHCKEFLKKNLLLVLVKFFKNFVKIWIPNLDFDLDYLLCNGRRKVLDHDTAEDKSLSFEITHIRNLEITWQKRSVTFRILLFVSIEKLCTWIDHAIVVGYPISSIKESLCFVSEGHDGMNDPIAKVFLANITGSLSLTCSKEVIFIMQNHYNLLP